MPNGKYIISGCPAGGGDNTYSIIANCTNNGSAKTLGKTIGGDAEIALEGDDTSNDSVWLGYTIVIKEGQTVSDLTFYPMIRRADILDSTYEPYHESVQNQINDKGVLGAKNLLQITAQSQTYGGIQYVVSNDGTITAKSGGTCSQNGQLEVNTAMTFKAGVKYILSGCCPNPPEENKGDFWLGVYNTSPANYDFMVEAGQETLVSYETDTTRVIKIRMLQGVELTSDLVYKPMIRLASDPDDTFVPYAMTNRELTEYEWQTIAYAQSSTSVTYEDTFAPFASLMDGKKYEYRIVAKSSGSPVAINRETRYSGNEFHFVTEFYYNSKMEHRLYVFNKSTGKMIFNSYTVDNNGALTYTDRSLETPSTSSTTYCLQQRKIVPM